jgi:hypothetical protein
MVMTQSIAALEDTVSVEYGQFILLDEDGSAGGEDAPSPWELGFDEEEWLQVTHNGALVSTGYSDHCVRVFFELWDGPPEPATTGQPREAKFFATSGRIRLTELVSRDDHVVFDLGRRAASWKLRVILYELRDPDEIGVVNSSSELEQYRFQFWPSPD